MLPEKSQGKVLQATVVAVGPGSVNQVMTCSRRGHTGGGGAATRISFTSCVTFCLFLPERELAASEREGRRESTPTRVRWN